MTPKSFNNIIVAVIGLICGVSYGDQVTDLVARLQKLDGKDSIRAIVHISDRLSKIQDEESILLEEADFVITADANTLTLIVDAKISNNRLFREFSILRAGQLAQYGSYLAKELEGLKLLENEPDVYRGVSCKRWRLKSERKESKFGISSTTLRDVTLWIDTDGYPVAGSFKTQTNGRMLLIKFNSKSMIEQRYQRTASRLVLVLDGNETNIKSKAGEEKRTVTTTVDVKQN